MRHRHEVVLDIHEWDEITDKLDRLDQLEAEIAEYQRRDREYLNWSLSPDRMTDALELARAIDGIRT